MNNKIILIDGFENRSFRTTNNEDKTFIIALLGEGSGDMEVKVNITGSNCEVQILGVILSNAEQVIKLSTIQEHINPESQSDLLIKSVLFGEAKFFYNGLIRIGEKAQKSNAYQKNQNILMGKNSWADSRPELEILANDVRCTHGATVGKIDKESIYYLQTRGINKKQATKLILSGFFTDVLERIPDDGIKKDLSGRLQVKLDQLITDHQI